MVPMWSSMKRRRMQRTRMQLTSRPSQTDQSTAQLLISAMQMMTDMWQKLTLLVKSNLTGQ